MNGQTTNTNWLDEEQNALSKGNTYSGTKLPALKMVEKINDKTVVYTLEIDCSEPFKKWSTFDNGKETNKAIIPLTHEGEKKVWWLNVLNPTYKEIIQRLSQGQRTFKIIQIGSQAQTRYSIIE